MPSAGFIIFMPWVTLPECVRVGPFRFCPLLINNVAAVVGKDMAETVKQALSCYVKKNGKPIDSCTIVLRPRHPVHWNIPREHWNEANAAARTLALGCLAEQRFFEGHFSPHLNSTMFHLVGQGIEAGSDQISAYFPRRGGGLQIGGLHFKDIIFQRPPQIEGTSCEVVNARLLKALQAARRKKHPVADAIDSSLEIFLLAHAETSELGWDSCVMLSAMAFEQLLEPAKSSAFATASAFADHWAPFAKICLAEAKRIKADEKFIVDQDIWPIHRKWMKELYEARSSKAHRGPRSEFRVNWQEWQHLVIAAFTYPLTVKLRLAEAGFYALSNGELGACEALDQLLDSDWGEGWKKPAEWPSILSMSERSRELHEVIERAFRAAELKTEQSPS